MFHIYNILQNTHAPILQNIYHIDKGGYILWCWLVGCFGFNGPLRQYFSLYQAVSQREGEREEKE